MTTYDGSGMPVDDTERIDVIFRDGMEARGCGDVFDWSWHKDDPSLDIISYEYVAP